MDVDKSAGRPAEEKRDQQRHEQHDVSEGQIPAPDTELDQRTGLLSIHSAIVRSTISRQHHYARDYDEDQHEKQRVDKHHIRVVILDADAVVDPRTVVVEALDAPIARAAVLGADRAHDFAVRAHLDRMHFLEHVDKGERRSQVTGVSFSRDEETDRQHHGEDRDYISEKGRFLI